MSEEGGCDTAAEETMARSSESQELQDNVTVQPQLCVKAGSRVHTVLKEKNQGLCRAFKDAFECNKDKII